MKNTLKSLLLIFAITILQSCKDDDFLQGKHMVFYHATKKIQFADIVYSAKMKGSFDSDTLMLQVVASNVGEQPVEVVLVNANIMTENEVITRAVSASRMTVNIPPGKSSVDTLYFVHINDMKIFQNSELPGGFGEKYFFLPAAISEATTSNTGIELKAEEAGYAAYLSKEKYADFNVYDIVSSEKLEATLLENINNLNKDQPQRGLRRPTTRQPDVRLARKEILVGGFWVSVKAFTHEGQLKMMCRILNHQGQTIYFDPSDFRITYDGKSMTPKNITYLDLPSSWTHTPGQLSRGERIRFMLSYEKTDSEAVLFNPSINYGEGKELIGEIPLQRVEIVP